MHNNIVIEQGVWSLHMRAVMEAGFEEGCTPPPPPPPALEILTQIANQWLGLPFLKQRQGSGQTCTWLSDLFKYNIV